MKHLSLILLLSGVLFAQHEPYEMLPDSAFNEYVEDADAVVLSDENIVTVDDSEIIYTVKKRIRINNKSGDEYDQVLLHEDEFATVSNIEAKITDILGLNEVELQDDDIQEFTYSSGYMVKAKAFDGRSKNYPYIAEYTYTYELGSLFFWPDWKPQTTEMDIPVVSSTYKLILEDKVPYKTYKIGFDLEPYIFEEDGDEVHLYSVKNIPPLDNESYLPKEYRIQNAILFAAEKFKLGNTEGSNESWDAFADWLRTLYKGRENLPQGLVSEINSLIANESDPYKKVDILYKFLQDKTRYVSIYLDIGGWQPHSSEWVYNNRFGDCKDLATLMIGLLKVAGIKAYPAFVLSKYHGHVIKEFPSNQFNHVITFIPLTADTLWVDCTVDYAGYKDTPYGLERTNALVVTEDKGEILSIPQRSSAENLDQSTIQGILQPNGTLELTGNIKSKGSVKTYYIENFAELKKDEIKRSLIREFTRYQPRFSMENYGFQHDKADESMCLVFSGKYTKFSRKVGKRLFLNPNILKRKLQQRVPEDENRTYPFDMVKYPYLDVDSLRIELPKNYTIESAPEMQNIEYPFGKYITSYKIEDGVFYYKRLFEYSTELIYPEEFDTFRAFYKTAVETDKSKFVLIEN